MKQIRIKKWSTHWSIRIWDTGTEEFPRVRSAKINADGTSSPYLAKILEEEKDGANIIIQK